MGNKMDSLVTRQATTLLIAAVFAVPLIASLLGFELLRPSVELMERLMQNHRFREISGYVLLSAVLFELGLSVRKRWKLRLPGRRRRWRELHVAVGVVMILGIVVHTGGRWGSNLNGLLLTAMLLGMVTALLGRVAESFPMEHLRQRLQKRAARKRAEKERLKKQAERAEESKDSELESDEGEQASSLDAKQGQGDPAKDAAAGSAKEPQPQSRFSAFAQMSTRRLRRISTGSSALWLRLHILLVAAALVLLGFHIFSVYYY